MNKDSDLVSVTRPELSVHMARNFLNTIQPIIVQERDSIHLPDRMLRLVLAEAHAWLGEKQFDIGDNRSAACNFLLSLHNHPWQARIGALALIALLPRGAGDSCRKLIRRIKALLQIKALL